MSTDRLCETRWLHRVLDCLSAAGRVHSPSGLAELRDQLSALVNDQDTPRAEAFASEGDRFRRHPLATVNSQGYSALLMYWPAGYATLPHDHDGLWGIEVVIDGRLDIDEYVKSGQAERPALTLARSFQLEAGQATMFTSEQYVHRCGTGRCRPDADVARLQRPARRVHELRARRSRTCHAAAPDRGQRPFAQLRASRERQKSQKLA